MVKLAIITPHGGTADELMQTVVSVCMLSIPEGLDVEHVIVVNNGADGLPETEVFETEVRLINLSINPIASRAKARNTALDYLQDKGFDGFVQFLDSGDLAEQGLIDAVSQGRAEDALWGNTVIQTEKGMLRKTRLPAALKKIVNTFYLGSIVVRLDLIKETRFQAGRKEDWKFWLEVFAFQNPTRCEDVIYTYTIKTKNTHFQRKIALYKHQWDFYREFLHHSVVTSAVKMVLHYSINAFVWAVLNRRRR